jgi:hypothetical protein
MGGWRLTIRHGPSVRTEEFDDLSNAVDAMRAAAVGVVREGPLEPAQGFREYEPSERVAARIGISSGGLWRNREAGIDVMGDGALVPYAGTVRRRRIAGRSPEAAIDAVAEALR